MTGPHPPTVALRPLGAGELLDGAVRLVRRNLRASLTLSVPIAVLWSAASAGADAAHRSLGTAEELLSLAISGFFATVLTGLLAPVFAGDVRGEQVAARTALGRVGRRWWPLVVVALLATVAQVVGIVLLVVGGVWLWGTWAVVAPALVIEGLGVRATFRRSFDLVRTQFWRTWGLRALGWALVGVLGFFVQLPFVAIAGAVTDLNPFDAGKGLNVTGTYLAIAAVGTLLSVAITAPITAAVDVLLYLDLRVRREGLDIVVAASAAPVAPAAPAAPVTAW